MSSIHFVITTYNGDVWIEECLNSVKKASPLSPIHIIDNCSSDNTVARCKALGLEIIELTKNLGFGAANNLGIEKAILSGASHVFLLNQDAYLDENAIDNFQSLDLIKKTDSIFSFLQLNGDGSDFDINWKKGYLADDNCPGFIKDLENDQVKSLYNMTFSNAAAWLIPVGLIRKIGGFSTTFFHYGEDTNYIHRIHYQGLSVKMCPNSIVRHDRSEQLRSSNPHLNERKQTTRKYLVNLSNPSEEIRPFLILLKTGRVFLQKLLQLQRPENIIEYHFLKLVFSIGFVKILRNRKKSRSLDAPFIDLNANT